MCVYFLKLIYITDGCGETIEKVILSYLEQVNIPISKISSFGSDGAVVQ